MRDMLVDAGGHRFVVGPDSPNQPLAQGVRTGIGWRHQAQPRGEHFLPDTRRLNLDADVVIAALSAPGAGRIVAGLRSDLRATASEIFDGRRDLLHEPD